MSRLPNIAGEFRLVADPELRFTQGGKAVCELRVVTNESRKNQAGEWEDGDRTPFLKVALFDRQAEAAAEVFTKGQRVLVTGQLYAETWQDREGNNRETPGIKWASVAAVPETNQGARPPAKPANDPWASAPPAAADPRAAPATDEPPF